jgi:hypothetical protein
VLEMNPEIRARWTAALRSGRFKQGRSALRSQDELCCLGVLCELAAEAGVVSAVPGKGDGHCWSYDGFVDYLPESVQEWAGLPGGNPLATAPGQRGAAPLAILNDEYDLSFAQIADAIDGGAQ